jgi:hypothetical protein
VCVAGGIFLGLSSFALWRGDLEAVRSFSRLFILYLVFDVFLILYVSGSFIFRYFSEYSILLLALLVLLPFYQKRLAQRVLAGHPELLAKGEVGGETT